MRRTLLLLSRLAAIGGVLGLLGGCAVYPAPVASVPYYDGGVGYYDGAVGYAAPVVVAPPVYYTAPSVTFFGRFGSGWGGHGYRGRDWHGQDRWHGHDGWRR